MSSLQIFSIFNLILSSKSQYHSLFYITNVSKIEMKLIGISQIEDLAKDAKSWLTLKDEDIVLQKMLHLRFILEDE